MKLKKLAALTLTGAMALSLAACGGGGNTSGSAGGSGNTSGSSGGGEVYKIGVLAPEVTHGWSAGVAYYARSAVRSWPARQDRVQVSVSATPPR